MTDGVLVAATRRFRVAAAFLPAARRFRGVTALLAAVRRFPVLAAFLAADAIANSFVARSVPVAV